MLTLELANGSRVPLVDVKSFQVCPHFFSRDEYYVQVELRDGGTRDVVERLSQKAAHNKKNEIARLIEKAWGELDAYGYGYEAGFRTGQSEGYSIGRADGQLDGRRIGYTDVLRSADGRFCRISSKDARRTSASCPIIQLFRRAGADFSAMP
jgi:hypothetical protein